MLSEWAMTVRPYAKALGQVMMTASVLMLVSLTWERHFAICYPHQYRIRIRTIPLWRHLARYIVPVVVLSFVLNIPTFINTYKVCTSNQSWYLISEIPTKTVHHSVRDNSTREHNVGKAALSQVISWDKIPKIVRANFKIRYFFALWPWNIFNSNKRNKEH